MKKLFRFKTFIFLLFYFLVLFFCNNTRKTRLDWDVFGYYLYLPAQFIYHDITLEKKEIWLSPLIEKYKTTDGFYQANVGPKNKYVMKYTMGLAFAYAPFFFMADFMAPHLGFERDGFSPPYQVMMLFCAIFFSLIGLFYCFKILNNFFSETVSFITICLIVFGSNYFMMTAFDCLMPHNVTFALFAIGLYFTIKWYEFQKLKFILIVGFCFGWAVLIRPTSAVVVIIPLFWGVGSFKDFKNKFLVFKKHYLQIAVFFIVIFLVIFPQLLYWKLTAGEWLYYSYPNEKLEFANYHFETIFSYKKGWLLYTPLMIIAIAGFYHLYRKKQKLFFPIFVFFILNAYLIGCWQCWWYGGSFSQRAFVESYVFMMFPLASFVAFVFIKKILIKSVTLIVLMFLVFLNLFQTRQSLTGVLHSTLITKEYYWKVFLKNSIIPDDQRWLEPAESTDWNDFMKTNREYKSIYFKNYFLYDSSFITLNNDRYTNPAFISTELPYQQQSCFLVSKIKVDCGSVDTTINFSNHWAISISHNNQKYKYRQFDFSNSELRKNRGEMKFSVVIPPQVNKDGWEIKSYFYTEKKNNLLPNNFCVEVFALR